MRLRQVMLAHIGKAQAEVVVCSGRDATSAIEIISNAFLKQSGVGLRRAIEQQIQPFLARIEGSEINAIFTIP